MDKKPEIVIVSSVFSHHQKPLSDALFDMLQGRFAFVETIGLTQELRTLGYNEARPPYLVRPYVGQTKEAERLICEADAVVFGGPQEKMILPRMLVNKLVFRCSERPLKHGMEPLKYFPRLVKWHRQNPQGKRVYLLCASAFAAGDYAKFGLFRNRSFKWGYFTPFKEYESPELLLKKKDPKKILWVGRFLDLKHADDALRAAKILKDCGMAFTLDLIGTGVMERQLRRLAESLELGGRVRFLGPMSPESVREHMEQAAILLVCSDKQEGWGAVVNEGMNSACAVICGHAVGSAPFLLENEQNGLIYPSCDVAALADRMSDLLSDRSKQAALGAEAYRTISEEWNPRLAAERLVELTENILSGGDGLGLFKSGPCSPADTIRDDWFPGKL
ncbi:MAG: glycosyltransferase [Clostridia bacterium]|nr:glycosyltransferase [Clostridia bacterium]